MSLACCPPPSNQTKKSVDLLLAPPILVPFQTLVVILLFGRRVSEPAMNARTQTQQAFILAIWGSREPRLLLLLRVPHGIVFRPAIVSNSAFIRHRSWRYPKDVTLIHTQRFRVIYLHNITSDLFYLFHLFAPPIIY